MPRNRILGLWAMCVALALTACVPVPTVTAPPASPTRPATSTATTSPPSATAPPTLTPAPAATSEPVFSATPPPTVAPSPTAPVPTDTPPPGSIPTRGQPVTRTPAPAAQCPPAGDAIALAPQRPADAASYAPAILAYLNARGSAEGLPAALAGLPETNADLSKLVAQVHVRDVTGDTVPDVVVSLILFVRSVEPRPGVILAFVCQTGQYQSFQVGWTGGYIFDREQDEGILAVQDMNLDGVPEIVFSEVPIVGTRGLYGRTVSIVEWDGAGFAPLIDDNGTRFANVQTGAGAVGDTNGDGTLELLLTHGGVGAYVDGGPQRPRTDIWAWNGRTFTLARVRYPIPLYRFQAVQDGDDASARGEYAAALASYQQAIFDDNMLGWIPGQLWPDRAYAGSPTPAPDPAERPRLSAYARYRIMLLHVVQRDKSSAQIVYTTLQEKFPLGELGRPYADLAAVFWEEHERSQDVGAACRQAIGFASANAPEILTPLGSSFYGYLNRDYRPEDICPFR